MEVRFHQGSSLSATARLVLPTVPDARGHPRDGRVPEPPAVPYSGAAAGNALAGLIWSRPLPRAAAWWTKPALLAGLALLAAVIDLPDRSGYYAEGLTTAACALLASGVLGRARLGRWAKLGAGLIAVLIVLVARDIARNPMVMPWEAAPDTTARLVAVVVPAFAVVLAGAAAIAAFSSPGGLRWAGLGLLPVLVPGFGVLPALTAEDRFAPKDVPGYFDEYAIAVTLRPLNLAEAERGFDAGAGPGALGSIQGPRLRSPAPAVEEEPWSPAKAVAQELLEIKTDLGAALRTGVILLGLAAMATARFPYRE
ncbi:hypothetical protein [Actinoplanes sp. NPDC089786]|uniref:hypothetical protein n=1 Tax=Actinoplanes sp. NPDC089786 TaxID=3155185 RepID=UPI0034323451